MRAFARFCLFLSVFAFSGGAFAQAGDREEILAFQQREARLFAAGWRIASATARYCDNVSLSTGVLLHDAAAYGEPGELRTALGLSGDIAVQAVAPGSPADLAGVKPNDTALTIGSLTPAALASDPAHPWRRMDAIRAAIDAELASDPAHPCR